MKSVKSIVQKVIPEQHVWKFELFKHWDSIIGHLKNRVSIEKIDEDTLYLKVCHPAWAQELSMLAPLLKEKINAHLSGHKIKHIRIKNRDIKTAAPKQTAKIKKALPTPKDIALNPKEQRILAQLPSKELQSVVASYLVRCKTIQRSKDED
jgi:hypothetical protein